MIYTVTFNPSLDYIVDVKGFALGMTNRTASEMMFPGGKGLNVSTVLRNLGVDSTAIYFSAGFVGDEITRLLRQRGVNADEIKLSDGCSRINIKLSSIEGTEINGMGPAISEENVDRLYQKLDALESGDILVLAGSIPASMPTTIYSDIMKRLQGKGVRFVVDATKTLLQNALEYKPFLIKPNNFELGDLLGVSLYTFEEIEPYARKVHEMGAENVIVSLAEKGAAIVTSKGEFYTLPAPKGEVINAVGSGDSMVAGFLSGCIGLGGGESLAGDELMHAFKMSVAAGSANAFSPSFGTKEEILRLYEEL